MNNILVRALPSVSCVLSAAYFLDQGKDGWGWFLFAALLFGNLVLNRTDEDDDC